MRVIMGVTGLVVGCAAAAMPALAQGKPYAGHALITATIDSPKDLLVLSQLGEMLACEARPGPVEFIIRPDAMDALRQSGVRYVVREADVQRMVDAEEEMLALAQAERGWDFFGIYQPLDLVVQYMDELDALPGLPAEQVTKFSIGTSVQNRQIQGLKITAPAVPGQPPKPVFIINACQHAREWVTVTSAMWVADRLVRGYGVDPVVTSLVDNVEFHIIPVMNPDGYVYSFPTAQGGGGQRFWRKNRRQNSATSFGVDLNRNWSFGWGGSGSSGTTTSDTYRGPSAFSEPETSRLRDYANALTNLKAHLDIHSYSQLVLAPWGYTSTLPPRHGEIDPITQAQATAMTSENNAFYVGGPASTTIYLASGVSTDWFHGQRGVLSWGYEMRDTGTYGFSLPPEQIVPTAEEAFAGVRVIAQHIQIRLSVTPGSIPSSLQPNIPSDFPVQITTANSYTLADGSAKLLWRVGSSGEFNESPLAGGPTNFTASLPGFPCGQSVEFFVQATASDGLIVRAPAAGFYTAATSDCPGCYGDANDDLLINFADVTEVLTRWGSSGVEGLPGDTNFDGVVGFSDITAALSVWTVGCN